MTCSNNGVWHIGGNGYATCLRERGGVRGRGSGKTHAYGRPLIAGEAREQPSAKAGYAAAAAAATLCHWRWSGADGFEGGLDLCERHMLT